MVYTSTMSDVIDLKNPEVTAEVQVTPESFPISADGFAGASWTADHAPSPREKFRERVLLAGLLILGGAVAYWQKSWMTAAVMVLGAIAWELHNFFPRTHRVHIDDTGVTIDDHKHHHERLASYDIHTMPDGSVRLSLMTRQWHLPYLHIPLGEQDPAQVEAVLSRYVIRGEHRIPLMDYFTKK